MLSFLHYFSLFFFTDTPTTEIYTLSLHDALPIYHRRFVEQDLRLEVFLLERRQYPPDDEIHVAIADRKSTRLNSSHLGISYAVFCLKKKKKKNNITKQ